jgi:hypothetical protein
MAAGSLDWIQYSQPHVWCDRLWGHGRAGVQITGCASRSSVPNQKLVDTLQKSDESISGYAESIACLQCFVKRCCVLLLPAGLLGWRGVLPPATASEARTSRLRHQAALRLPTQAGAASACSAAVPGGQMFRQYGSWHRDAPSCSPTSRQANVSPPGTAALQANASSSTQVL